MKNFAKVSIALTAIGGTLLMASPLAFASSYDPAGLQAAAAGSSQWQNGSNATGTTMDQNSGVSSGQMEAQNFYSSSKNNGGSSSTNNYMVDDEGHSVLASSTSSSNGAGNSWTQAKNYSTEGSGVTQDQSQIITTNDKHTDDSGVQGGMQGQKSGAITANVNADWTLTGGVAVNKQSQNGSGAYQATLDQNSNVQTGDTTASHITTDANIGASYNQTNKYSGGNLASSTSNSLGSSSNYMNAKNFTNPTAGVSQDQNQIIGLDGYGATQNQKSGALSGQVTDEFWVSLLFGQGL